MKNIWMNCKVNIKLIAINMVVNDIIMDRMKMGI